MGTIVPVGIFFMSKCVYIFLGHCIIKARFSETNFTEHKICVLIFSTTFVDNVSHPTEYSARYYHKLTRPSCKVPVIVVIFDPNLNFLERV